MEVREVIEKAIQELVNTKHLYQSVILDFGPCVREEAREAFTRQRGTGISLPLHSPDKSEEEIKESLRSELDSKDWQYGAVYKGLPGFFTLPPVRLLCSVCEEVEAWSAPLKLSQN
jgi:hypothetical protein